MTDEQQEITDKDIKELSPYQLAAKWLMKQGVVSALLCLILGAMLYGGYYGMTTAIPAHLKQIQSGYETVIEQATTEHRKAVEAIERSHDAERQLYRELLRGTKGTMAGTQKPNSDELIP